MQNTANKGSRNLKRVFKVGVVGASDNEFNLLTRIFTVTQYRSRSYEAKQLLSNQFNKDCGVDFVLICSQNPTLIHAWDNHQKSSATKIPPLIFLSRGTNPKQTGKYQICSPVNPSKLIKLLDHYTIKELNFLPEFEIGHDSHELDGLAISGLKILRSSSNNAANVENPSRALIVDDSLAVRKQMQIEFELLHDRLDTVENAEKALEAVEKVKYDIIFLDVVMPGIDGYAACKQIKRSALNKQTPVIMLTSRSSSFDKIKGTLAGCDAYLVKPINHNEFESIYKKYVVKSNGDTANGCY